MVSVPDRLNGALLAVLVVYEKRIEAIPSMAMLTAWLARNSGEGATLRQVLVYDNGKTASEEFAALASNRLRYVHDPANGGTAAAYSLAAGIATELGCKWLLLLDHDTSLPDDYLDSIGAAIAESGVDNAAAFVPSVRHGSSLISPATISCLGSIRPFGQTRQIASEQNRQLTAIASGAVIDVQRLLAVLPFPEALWLDYVDHWIFLTLQEQGGRILQIDATLTHDLSIASLRSVSTRRLYSILDGEVLFHRKLGILARAIYPLRLMARLARYALVVPHLARGVVGWIFSRSR
jgi:GT2 family glycosyltransferase